MLKGLKALILERFSPATYLPMIIVFSLANGLYFYFVRNVQFNLSIIIVCGLVMLSAFFRLRLFDEIKDYGVDLKINPERPLARGTIQSIEIKLVIWLLIFFELFVTSLINQTAFFVHGIAIVYSLLMYKEFFIGNLIRSRLVVYAVSHTFVSVLFGLSTATIAFKCNSLKEALAAICFFLVNWAYFNLFEFSRKTFASNEERKNVETYSSLFKPLGAALLSFSQVLLALIILAVTVQINMLVICLLSLVYCGFLVLYVRQPIEKFAKLLRHASGAFIILSYCILILNFWR